ncbi:MAG: hypothetical protein WAU24_03210 [Chitinophagaceae bacterium]
MKKQVLLSLCVAAVTLQSMGQANTNLSNLTSPTKINETLLPKSDSSKNLGSPAKSWKNVYVAGRSYLSTAYSYFDNATNQFRINNGVDGFVMKNNGNIGIGTLAPAFRLDVQTTGLTTLMQVKKPYVGSGTTNFNLVEINNAYNFGYGTGLFASGGQMGVKGYAPNGGATGYGVYGEAFGGSGFSYGVYGKSSSAGGTVGVYGSAASTGSTSYGVYGSASSNSSSSAYGVYGYASGSGTNFAGYFSGRGYFSGNLGLGTATPDVKLHIIGGTDASPASGGYLVTGSITASNIAIDDNEIMARNNGLTSTLFLNNNGGDLVMCTSSGNVMIGTTTPAAGYILSVDGKIMSEELKVQLSGDWPDYVFHDNYKLPSLQNLETSIKINKRLPGMPSADEVKKDGIIVGQMQTKMMEKIEELTLYIISLQKQIDELKKSQP